MHKGSIQDVIYKCLKKHGPMLNSEIAELTGKKLQAVNNGLFQLKHKGRIGKVGMHWQVGSFHNPKRIQVEVLNMIAEGIYTPKEIAERLDTTPCAISNEVARLRRAGVGVKRVYIFED